MRRPIVFYACVWVMGYSLAIAHFVPQLPWLLTVSLIAVAIGLLVVHVPGKPLFLTACVLFIALGYYQWFDARNVSRLLPEMVQAKQGSGATEGGGAVTGKTGAERSSGAAKGAGGAERSSGAAKGASGAERSSGAQLDIADVELRGVLASTVEVDGDRASFTLEASEIRFKRTSDAFPMHQESVTVQLRLLEQSEQGVAARWRRGDTLTLSGSLRSPPAARNFGGFDYSRYLQLHHIHWQFAVTGTAHVQSQAYTPSFHLTTLLRAIDALRANLAERIERFFPSSQAGFMKAMLIGDSQELDPERFQQFSALGLTHIIAISGLNIAVFLAALIWLLRLCKLSRKNYYFIAMLSLPFYILLTGASPSVIRAGLMAMIVCWMAQQNLQKDILHVLTVVGVAMLIWHPYYVLDVSFQLSFFVTIGLIVGVNRVNLLLPFKSKFVLNTIAVTLVSQGVSFPLSIYYFNQFSLISGLANALIVPVMSLVVYPAGLIALVLSFVSMDLASLLGTGVSWLNALVFQCTDVMQGWTIFQTIWPSPSILWIITYFILLTTLLLLLLRRKQQIRLHTDSPQSSLAEPIDASSDTPSLTPSNPSSNGKQDLLIPDWSTPKGPSHRFHFKWLANRPTWRQRLMNVMIVLGCLGFAGHLYIGYGPDRWNHDALVQMIDVGQGDAILIRTPQHKFILIDGGGSLPFQKANDAWKTRIDPYDVGRKLLVPLLKKRGVQQIDYLLLTHQDLDHSGGLLAILAQIPVKALYFNGTYKPNAHNQRLFQTALSRNIPLYTATQGQVIDIEPTVRMQVLYPQAPQHKVDIREQQNDFSIVHLLEIAGTRWLFTGDMELSAEQDVLQALKGQVPQQSVDVLKVAHHGSKTSTSQAWLDYWQPRYACISVGAKNSYGHPAPVVIDRLHQKQVITYRTDQLGEIQFRIRQGAIAIASKFQLLSK